LYLFFFVLKAELQELKFEFF